MQQVPGGTHALLFLISGSGGHAPLANPTILWESLFFLPSPAHDPTPPTHSLRPRWPRPSTPPFLAVSAGYGLGLSLPPPAMALGSLFLLPPSLATALGSLFSRRTRTLYPRAPSTLSGYGPRRDRDALPHQGLLVAVDGVGAVGYALPRHLPGALPGDERPDLLRARQAQETFFVSITVQAGEASEALLCCLCLSVGSALAEMGYRA